MTLRPCAAENGISEWKTIQELAVVIIATGTNLVSETPKTA
jgi:hypothetical protein